jgi:hypothetical protein
MVEKNPLISKHWKWILLGALLAMQIARVVFLPMRGDEAFPLIVGEISDWEKFSDIWMEGISASPIHIFLCWLLGMKSLLMLRLFSLFIWWLGGFAWYLFFQKKTALRSLYFPWILLWGLSDLGLFSATDGQFYSWIFLASGIWIHFLNRSISDWWKMAPLMGLFLGFIGITSLALPLAWVFIQPRKAGAWALMMATAFLVYQLFNHAPYSATPDEIFSFTKEINWKSLFQDSGFIGPIGGMAWIFVFIMLMKKDEYIWMKSLSIIGLMKVLMALTFIFIGLRWPEGRYFLAFEIMLSLLVGYIIQKNNARKWFLPLLFLGLIHSVYQWHNVRTKEETRRNTEYQKNQIFDDRLDHMNFVYWARARWQYHQNPILIFEEQGNRGLFMSTLVDAAEEKQMIGK